MKRFLPVALCLAALFVVTEAVVGYPHLPWFFNKDLSQLQRVLEALAVVTAGWSITLEVRERVALWPIGIVSAVLFGVLFFLQMNWANVGLQVFYVVVYVHGWYWWLRGGEGGTELMVSRAGGRLMASLLGVGTVVTILFAAFLARIKDPAPLPDAATTVFSLVAQFLLNTKRIENWLVWFVVNLAYVWLFGSQGYYLSAALFVYLASLTFPGWAEWSKSLARLSSPGSA